MIPSRKQYRALIFSFLFCFVSAYAARAADYCVQSGAAGNGSDWNNACGALPATLERGSTYYLAGGDYPEYAFDDPADGEQYIVIKKATKAEHGPQTGWDDAYARDQAAFPRVRFLQPYYRFDGQYGAADTGHGIKIRTTDLDQKCIDIRNHDAYDGHHIDIAHVECEHAGMDRAGGNNADAIYMLGTGTRYVTNVTFKHVYAHDATRTLVLARNSRYITFDHCYFARCMNDHGIHGEGVSWDTSGEMHVTFAHCIWRDIEGAGNIVIGLDHSTTHSYFEVYGNLFYTTDPAVYTSTDGIITSCSGNGMTNAKIYNNTFAFIGSPYEMSVGIVTWAAGGAGNEAYNNLVYNLEDPGVWGNTGHDYNWFSGSGVQTETHIQNGAADPFVDSTHYDFRLAMPTDPGISLAAPYNLDPNDILRGADGTWDRGAYEFVSGAPQPPAVPSNVLTAAVSATQINVSWNASAGATEYRVDVSTQASFTGYVTGWQDHSVGNVTDCSVTGMTPSTTYYTRLRAIGPGGTSANSSTAQAATQSDGDDDSAPGTGDGGGGGGGCFISALSLGF